MQVPEQLRKCVAFIGCRKAKGEIVIGGTVFFVGKQLPGDLSFGYAVTAAHCIKEIKKLGSDNVLVRLNTKGGGFRWVETEIEYWNQHPNDESVDVAITRFELPAEADHLHWPIREFASAEHIMGNSIAVGDEVCFPGLFRPHKDEKRNIPIVRLGTIAALPEEPVSTGMGDMEAFLVECRSIGGLSGSPVFLSPGLVRVINGQVAVQSSNPDRTFHLIGIMHGHFGVSAFDKITGDDPLTRERLNMGIAIVPTYNKIWEVLNQPGIVELENEALERLRIKNLPIMDSEEMSSGSA